MKMSPHLTMEMNSSSTRSKLVLTISKTRQTSTSSIEDSDSISAVSTPSTDLDSDGSELNVTSRENMIAKRSHSKESFLKNPFNSDVLETFNINLEDETSVSWDKSEPLTADSEEIDKLVDNFRTTSLIGNEFNDVTEKFRNLEPLESNSEMRTTPSDSSKESKRTQGDVDNVRHEYSNDDQKIVNSSFDNTKVITVNIFDNNNDTETETKKKTDDSQKDSSSDEDDCGLISRGPTKKECHPNRLAIPYQKKVRDANQMYIDNGVEQIMKDNRNSRIMNTVIPLVYDRSNSSTIDKKEENVSNTPYKSNTEFTGTEQNSSVSNSPLSVMDELNIILESCENYQYAVENHDTEITTNIDNLTIYSGNNSPTPSHVQPPYDNTNISLENGIEVLKGSPFYKVESPSIYQEQFMYSPNTFISDTQVVNNAYEQSWQPYNSFNEISDGIEQTQTDLSSQMTSTNVPNFVADSPESRTNYYNELYLKQDAGITTYNNILHLEQPTPISLPVLPIATSTVPLVPKTLGKVDIWRLLNLPTTNATNALVRELSEKHLFKAMSKVLCKSNKELTSVDNAMYTQLMYLVKDVDQMKNKQYKAYLIALVERIADIPGSLSAMNNHGEDALYLAAINYPQIPCISGYLAAAMVKRRIVISHNLYRGGNTLIHVVAAKGDTHIGVLSELLALKTNEGNCVFDLSKVNYCGKTALDMAFEAQNTSVPQIPLNDTVQLLLKHDKDSIIKETPSRTFKL